MPRERRCNERVITDLLRLSGSTLSVSDPRPCRELPCNISLRETRASLARRVLVTRRNSSVAASLKQAAFIVADTDLFWCSRHVAQSRQFGAAISGSNRRKKFCNTRRLCLVPAATEPGVDVVQLSRSFRLTPSISRFYTRATCRNLMQ
jgi:hypothetical protein